MNVIAPGFITTDMTSVLPEKIKTEVKDAFPCGGWERRRILPTWSAISPARRELRRRAR